MRIIAKKIETGGVMGAFQKGQNIRITLLGMFLLFIYSKIAYANVLGVNYQNFFPTPDQADYITVHSSESVRAKKWRMHFFVSYSENNLFAYDINSENQETHTITDQLSSGVLGVAYGITSRLEYGVSLPMNWNHNVKPESDKSYIVQRWVTMIHNQFKYVLKRRGEEKLDDSGSALVVSIDLPNTRQDGFLGDRQTPILTAEVVYDSGNEVESYSINGGYRIRSPGNAYADSPVLPLEDQLLFSAAYQRQFQSYRKMNWIVEFYGAYPVDLGKYKRAKDISSSEVLFGLRSGSSKRERWTAGVGAEVFKGTMSPDWRAFVGWSWDFNWLKQTKEKDALLNQRKIHGVADDIADPLTDNSGPLIEDSDRDRVYDDDDMCPNTPRGVQVDREGCPFDSDNDTIPDYEDRCPNTPQGEVVNSQGCKVLK